MERAEAGGGDDQGGRPQKKIVGQQVRRVYPQAGFLSTDVVPDIFRTAEASAGWIGMDMALRKGERVRIIAKGAGESIVEVVEIGPRRFRVVPVVSDGPIFVYGREVNDFLVVDYDAIAMLNVSAMQQLKKEKDAEGHRLHMECESLRRESATLHEEISDLRSRLDRLEKLVEGTALARATLDNAVPAKKER